MGEEGGGGVGIRAEDLVEALAELGAEAARPRGPHGGTAARGASQVLQQMLRPPAAIRTHRSDLMLIKSIHKNLLGHFSLPFLPGEGVVCDSLGLWRAGGEGGAQGGHGGVNSHRRGYILTADQSTAGRASIFSRRTNRVTHLASGGGVAKAVHKAAMVG
eukprot:1183939-Prorocentrum_minimum.AAC.3